MWRSKLLIIAIASGASAEWTKCCPPGFLYDHRDRSCVPTTDDDPFKHKSKDDASSKFGLPHCHVITDHQFASRTDLELLNDTLFLRGEYFTDGQFCVGGAVGGGVTVRACRGMGVCERTRCVRKCCPDGQSFVGGSFCRDTFVNGLRLHQVRAFAGNFSDDFAIIHGYPGPGRVAHHPSPLNFTLDGEGVFHNHVTNEILLPADQTYCIEHATKNNVTFGHVYFDFLVGSEPPLPKKFLSNRAAMMVSGLFVVLTIAFYVATREIRKVFAKAMVSFCLSLLALYAVLVYCTFASNLHYERRRVACKVIGFSIIYLGFSCFIWLQIISFDIYWTFGSTKNFSSESEKNRKVLRRFILYSLYGWGVPLVITAFPALFHYLDVLPAPIEIRMGNTRCAIERNDGNYAEILFRTIPLSAIQMMNVGLFFKTVSYCIKVKNEIKKMTDCPLNAKKKRKFFAKRERFQLVVKLSFIMGILYVFEVVSSFVDFKANAITSTIEIIWDFINCLQGLFIFLIFVCKKKNFKNCKKSAAFEKIRKISLSSTRTTTVSTETRKSGHCRAKNADGEANKKIPVT